MGLEMSSGISVSYHMFAKATLVPLERHDYVVEQKNNPLKSIVGTTRYASEGVYPSTCECGH